jgi:hypothetical protein
MAPPTPSSNIKVFVLWSRHTVFAGEEIECQITFKNVAPTNSNPKPTSRPSGNNGFAPGGERQRKTTPLQASAAQARGHAATNSRSNNVKGHRASFSLNLPVGEARLPLRSPGPRTATASDAGTEERSHRRSVSIISLGITEAGGEESASPRSFTEGPRRPIRGHGRASSLQIVPRSRRPSLGGGGPLSGKVQISCFI